MKTQQELEVIWRTAPPGTSVIKEGTTGPGDWFYIETLGAWAEIPHKAYGEKIETCGHLIARGKTGMEQPTEQN